MKSTVRLALRLITLIAALFCLAIPAFAGGPLIVCQDGQDFLWPNGGTNIPFNPDQGSLGPLSNAQAVGLVNDAFNQWGNLPTATTTYVNAGPLPVDVDINNFFPFLFPAAPDGLSAIIFDDTGEIFDLLFGPGSGVLGFASPEWIDGSNCTIIEGVAFLNGPAMTDPVAALDIMTHEFGHYQGLAHSVVNGQIVLGDNTGPTPNDTFPIEPLANKIETMYPFYFGPGSGTATPKKDDIAIFSSLYPAPTWAATTANISGRILSPNGTTPLTGVNVIARNVANPFVDAVSAISSDFAFDLSPTGPLVGRYTLHGLTPGAQYALYVDEILAGGFSTEPLTPLPGPEELYNGAGESTNGSTDNPAVFTPITVAAGATQSNVNVLFNAPAPDTPLPVGDDGSVELFPPFSVSICGQTFSSVFANANGSLTFGAGSGDFSESVGEFLAGPPRAAGLWDDLNPAAGGSVFFEQTANTFTVFWKNVPEFPATGANTFSITLVRGVNNVDVQYGALSATDGLAGVSCGGAITSGFERPSNLSHGFILPNLLALQPAIFELFGPGHPNDLANDQVRYNALTFYADHFENNNTLAKAKQVTLPFTTEDSLFKFTEIKPAGNDVDFFKFSVKAGDILAVEVVRGNLDTVVGIFDRNTNTLIAADDDGGAGLLSRLLVQANVDLDLAVAVSTFPDFGFTGAGNGSGRYVLAIHKYRGTILAAGDDTSTLFNFTGGFTFPFQGSNRTSVFVNSNGNLTFGAGDADFSESVPEFLAGPPRIAPQWNDLDANGGLVIAEPHGSQDVTFHFVSVPRFFSTVPNYFSVKLERNGDIDMDYFATDRADALAGVTKGGGAADPGETDLSRQLFLHAGGTTYEFFNPAEVLLFDLFFSDLTFKH